MRAKVLAALPLVLFGCGRSFSRGSGAESGPPLARAVPETVAPRGASTITVSGGEPPFTFAFAAPGPLSGPGVKLDASTGAYVAGSGGNAVDNIVVTDRQHRTATTQVVVGAPVSISPPFAILSPGQNLSFVASGGQPPVTFALQSSCSASSAAGSGSTLDPATGAYRAGTACNATDDVVTATDAVGNAASATVRVGNALAVAPSSLYMAPGQSVTLSVGGGVSPYHFQLLPHGNGSGASPISPDGVYTVGPNPNTVDRIRVTDSAGAFADVTAQITDPLVRLGLSPSSSDARDLYLLDHGDYNGDGIDDAMVVTGGNASPLQLEIVLGSNSGWKPTPVATFPFQVCFTSPGDLDGDGIGDLVLGEYDPTTTGWPCHTQRIYFGSPDGQLRTGPVIESSPDAGFSVGLPLVMPLAGSGPVLALPLATEQSLTVALLRIRADMPGAAFDTALGSEPLEQVGQLGPYPLSGDQLYPWSVTQAFSARDGVPTAEISAVSSQSGNWVVFVNEGFSWSPDAGVDQGVRAALGIPCTGDTISTPDFIDYDGDGILDLWKWEWDNGDPFTGNELFIVNKGYPDGGFSDYLAGPLIWSGLVSYEGVTRRLNASSTQDEMVLLGGTGLVRLYNDAPTDFRETLLPQQYLKITSADFNHDGIEDLAAVDGVGQLRLLTADAFGGLETGRRLDVNVAVRSWTVATDLEGSGDWSLVVVDGLPANGLGGSVSAFTSQGDGGFSEDLKLSIPFEAGAVSAGPPGKAWYATHLAPGPHAALFPIVLGVDGGLGEPISMDGLLTTSNGDHFLDLVEFNGGGALPGHDLLAIWNPTGINDEQLAVYPLPLDASGTPSATAAGGAATVIALGRRAAPVELESGTPGLVVVTAPSANSGLEQLQLHSGSRNAAGQVVGWSTQPVAAAEPLDAFFDQTAPQNASSTVSAMASFAPKVGGARDHVAVLAALDTAGPCASATKLLSIDVSSGALPQHPAWSAELPDACAPGPREDTSQLLALDLDGDGNTDLLVPDGKDGRLFVYRGDGTGQFPSASIIALGGRISAVAGGPLTDDHRTSLAVLRSDLGAVDVVLQNADGTFH